MIRNIDAHSHYHRPDHQEGEIVFVNSTKEEEWQGLINSHDLLPNVIPFFGIHPWCMHSVTSGWEMRLRKIVEDQLRSCSVGIGETGLDRSRSDFETQREIFSKHIEIARDLKVPVNIHCVRAWSDVLQILHDKRVGTLPILLHSFTGNKEIRQQLLRCNVFFSLKLVGEDHAARTGRGMVPRIPRERLLLETDALPENFSKDTTLSGTEYSKILKETYDVAAQLLGITLPELEEQIRGNFRKLFPTHDKQ